MAETAALRRARGPGELAFSAAERAQREPALPSAAMTQWLSTMDTYGRRVEVLTKKHVLPHVDSPAAFAAGLERLQAELDVLALRGARSARAAAKRISAHGRREVAKLLGYLPPDDVRARLVNEAFTVHVVQDLAKVGRDQVTRLREVYAASAASERAAALEHALWVSRNRAALVARSRGYDLHRDVIRTWSQVTGSEWGVVLTRRDERVRKSHRPHDGERRRWNDPPAIFGEPGCRCCMIPEEAFEPK